MSITRPIYLIALIGVSCVLSSCSRNGDVWENTKSAGRHMKRGVKALTGTCGDSRQIQCRDDFECIEEDACYPQEDFQEYDYQEQGNYPQNSANDFIALNDPSNELGQRNALATPPNATPGDPGCPVPGIQAFHDPSEIPQLACIFQPIHFDYDSSLIKGSENLQIIHHIADFLQSHPHIYVFIEGHTDERGPQAYNLALGARRANTVRNALTGEGVDGDRLFTISYGKERPVISEHSESGWARNRRAEFKIYER